ncbi:hypothetical protein ACF0H5_019543 [Mactra antiquata]
MSSDTDLKRGKLKKKFVTGPPPIDPQKCYVNPNEEEQMEIQGFIVSKIQTGIIYFLCLITLGLLRLVFHWMPHWYLWATHRKSGLAEATSVLLKDQYKQWFVAVVQTITKDGTRVSVIKPSASFSLSSKTKRQRGHLFLNTGQKDENLIRYFIVKRVKYIWNPDEDRYQKLHGLEKDGTCSYFYNADGLNFEHQRKRRVLYGTNSISVHVTPILSLLFKEGLSPFYVFQVFSVSVWFSDEYYYYAACIVLISMISLTTTIYQTRQMQRALRNTIQASTVVSVCRGGDVYEEIHSDDLVPGDIIEIPSYGCTMHCDAVLISGNCIVNESMLTGESVPVTKTPVTECNTKFNIKEHAKNTLFCGTHVIQTRYYGNKKVKAVVLRTGFLTSKGELVRAILYPKPVDFKFNRDTYFFVGVLAFIAGIGLVYTVILKVQRGDEVGEIIKRSLDLITIAVPPALPAALTVGIVFAQSRMKRQAIYCISPRSINICGSINAVCFDKTGTLTEDGLNMQGVISAENGVFSDEITNMIVLRKGLVMDAMATCHSLTLIDGRLSGDPLDLIMFDSIEWVLEESGEDNSKFDMLVPTIVYPKSSKEHTMTAEQLEHIDSPGSELGIVRQFPFSSSLQRMSVIVRRIGGTYFELFCKGSPEMITSLCTPETVPDNFAEVLRSYTQHGYRVIALAWKQLSNKYNYVKVQRVARDKVETELNFLGLLVMENKLKPETTPVIEQLQEADIRTIMITGDNMLTALSVAHDCMMVESTDKIVLVEANMSNKDSTQPCIRFNFEESIKETSKDEVFGKDVTIQMLDDKSKIKFAMTGKTWDIVRRYFPDELQKILVRGVVFARMSPEQKAQLIEALQEIGYYVAMCGDGANDCGALKMAHTGISLSEAEASVASPFTSKHPNVECVPTVIREGRAALVTSFGIFKYMACYSLTQFVSVLILYHVDSNLTDFEFLYIDLALLTTLSVTYGRTEAHPKIAKEPPQLSLTSLAPILSLVLQMAIQIASQVFCFLNVQQQPWFEAHVSEEEYDFMSYENTAVFSVSVYQYIALAIAFSKGSPYRRHMFTNYLFLLNIVLCFGMSFWLTLFPTPFLEEYFELQPPPVVAYRFVFFGVAIFNCLLSIVMETFLLDHAHMREKFRQFKERCFPTFKFEYKIIEDEILSTPGWPPVGNEVIVAEETDDLISMDIYATETDLMLEDADVNNSCNSLFGSSSQSIPHKSGAYIPDVEVARQQEVGNHGDGIDVAREAQITMATDA